MRWRWWPLCTAHGSEVHRPPLTGPSPSVRSGYFSPDGRYFHGWWGRRMCRKCTAGLPVGRSAERKPTSDAGRLTQVGSRLAKGAETAAFSLGSTVASSRVAVGSVAESRGEAIWFHTWAESRRTRRKPP